MMLLPFPTFDYNPLSPPSPPPPPPLLNPTRNDYSFFPLYLSFPMRAPGRIENLVCLNKKGRGYFNSPMRANGCRELQQGRKGRGREREKEKKKKEKEKEV